MFEAPTADTLSKQIRADLAAEIPGANPWLWPNNLYVVSKVFAQALRAAYLRLQELHKQMFVATATGDYLDGHAIDRGTARNPATLAAGGIVFTGTNGHTIVAGTRILRDDGVTFDLTADVTIGAVPTAGSIVAEDPGKAANCLPASPLALETPDDDVTAIVVDANGISGGLDQESDASLRARLFDLKRNPPHGGSPSEIIRWILADKPGVTRVFVQRATPAAGQLTVVFMMDDTYPDGRPLAGDVADVVAILAADYPASAKINVFAPTLIPVDVVISNVQPDTTAVQTAIEAELAAMFRRRAEPGSSLANFNFSRSWLDEAISDATGETAHILTTPAADVSVGVDTAGTPELVTLGTVTFV